jgi:uracil permease
MTLKTLKVDEIPPLPLLFPLSLQHLFAMYGATVLVPILFKVDPATVLLFNGIGTLIYLACNRWTVPAYLGSSFAYISPVLAIIPVYGYGAALCGFIASGFFFVIVGLLIRKTGVGWFRIIFPDAVMGAIVAVIGLELAPAAAEMAGFSTTSPNPTAIGIALFTLLVVIISMTMVRGFFRLFPILLGIIAGTLVSLPAGLVSLSTVNQAPWFAFPTLYLPVWSPEAIIFLLPASIVVLAELIGHLWVTGTIVEKDLIHDPGLEWTLIGKGISTMISGFFGSPPNTTYAENIGVLAITRVFSTSVIAMAALGAIAISFCGKASAAILAIPTPVVGGISLLLFGVIAALGIRMLVDSRSDLSSRRNLVLVAVILILGVSGAQVTLWGMAIKGMALATLVGVGLSATFWFLERTGLIDKDTGINQGYSMIDKNPLPLLIFDPDLNILNANPAFERLSGYPRNKLLDMKVDDFEILAKSGPGYRDILLLKIWDSSITTFRFPSGVLVIEQNFIPYLDKYGNVMAMIAGYTDITETIVKDREIMEREQDLRSAVAQITDNMTTFATLNDQIRNPLTVLAILTEDLEPEYQKRFAECICQIDEIVDQMDKGWLDSEKVRSYLKKHHNID